ncbi:unnamed protein product, partial [Discosporangium mesarthrocarpum]
MISLEWECLEGADAYVSDLSSNDSLSDREPDDIVYTPRIYKDPPPSQRNAQDVFQKIKPSILDIRLTDQQQEKGRSNGKKESLGKKEEPNCPKDTIQFEVRPEVIRRGYAGEGAPSLVFLEGNFESWELKVVPSLLSFVEGIKHIHLQAILVLITLPSLLEHPQIRPYINMCEKHTIDFEPPDESLETPPDFSFASGSAWDSGEAGCEEEGKAGDLEDMDVGDVERTLGQSEWAKDLEQSHYLRGLQQQTVRSLTANHNAVYRMTKTFSSLLTTLQQSLTLFTGERDHQKAQHSEVVDVDQKAAELIGGGGGQPYRLEISKVCPVNDTMEWVLNWKKRLEEFKAAVINQSTISPQVLLSVNDTKVVDYLLTVPTAFLRDLSEIGPVMLVGMANQYKAVMRRCNAILSSKAVGVEAIGEQVRYCCILCGWIWVKKNRREDERGGSKKKNVDIFPSSLWSMPTLMTFQMCFLLEVESQMPFLEGELHGMSQLRAVFQDLGSFSVVGNGMSRKDGHTIPNNSNTHGCSRSPGSRTPVHTTEEGMLAHKYDPRTMKSTVDEALKYIIDQYRALQSTINLAHINMQDTGRVFNKILNEALAALLCDVIDLEKRVSAKEFSNPSTDPEDACRLLRTYGSSLAVLQKKEDCYHRYIGVLDCKLFEEDNGASERSRGKDKESHMRDNERIHFYMEIIASTHARETLLWEALRAATSLKRQWLKATLISCQPVRMSHDHSSAVREYTSAVKVVGETPAAELCRATLAHCRDILGVVKALMNQNLTSSYWTQIEKVMPMEESIKADGRNKNMAVLREALGLHPSVEGNASGTGENLEYHNQGTLPINSKDDVVSTQDNGPLRSQTKNKLDPEGGGSQSYTKTSTSKISSVFLVGGLANKSSTGEARKKREEHTRFMELNKISPMAAAWGGLEISLLMDHGLLTKRHEIDIISAEATASAVLKQTLEELKAVWEGVPMRFDWWFSGEEPRYGDPEKMSAISRDKSWWETADLLAAKVDRGGTGTGRQESGYTRLLSNGDELLELVEHCRVVVGTVINAPNALLVAVNICEKAVWWQKNLTWFQELIVLWLAVQEQWVRLAPGFSMKEVTDGQALHEQRRFTEVSRRFQTILSQMQQTKHLEVLADQLGMNRGGRSLLSKVHKIQEDLENLGSGMDRQGPAKWLQEWTASCPRLLALPRYQLFRLFREWTTGRVASGASLGALNEHIAKVFRGIAEIIWRKVVDGVGQLAAVGAHSAGGGLETMCFVSPAILKSDMDEWFIDLERQLVVVIMRDIARSIDVLKRHDASNSTQSMTAQNPLLLKSGRSAKSNTTTDTKGTRVKQGKRRGDRKGSMDEGKGNLGREPTNLSRVDDDSKSYVCLQGQLLARSVHWTSQVEKVFHSAGARGSAKGAERLEMALNGLSSSLTCHVDGWAKVLASPGGLNQLAVISNAAFVTQAMYQRDIVEDLMPKSQPANGLPGKRDHPPEVNSFAWTCHLRYYFNSPKQDGEDLSASKDENEEDDLRPLPKPVLRVSVGPWHAPYGFEYCGTMEKLWLSPLSERCLLHTAHSAKGYLAGLLIPAMGQGGHGNAVSASDAVGNATAAQDFAIAFGRPFRLLAAGQVTSPHAVSNALAGALAAGGVTVVAGLDALPHLTLAVLVESLQAVAISLQAGREWVLVNGHEVSLASPQPHLDPGFDPHLHQWKLLLGSWDSSKACQAQLPLIGVFGTLTSPWPDPQIPLSIRVVFRPVLIAPPNLPLTLIAMMFARGFIHATELFTAIVEGLHNLHSKAQDSVGNDDDGVTTGDYLQNPPTLGKWSIHTLLHTIMKTTVVLASGLHASERARQLRLATKMLGLKSLPAVDRQRHVQAIVRGVEAQVFIASLVHSLLEVEMADRKFLCPDGDGDGPGNTCRRPEGATGWEQTHDDQSLEYMEYKELRRTIMVDILESSSVFADMTATLRDMGNGRKMTTQDTKGRPLQLAEAGAAVRDRGVSTFEKMIKRALKVNGMSPTVEQIKAGVSLWDALWSCRATAVIVTGPTGSGKSAILHAMPHMAEYVQLKIVAKLQKAIKRWKASSSKGTKGQGGYTAISNRPTWAGSPLDATKDSSFQPPVNARGAAPYRRICNRIMKFTDFLRGTASFRTSSGCNDDDGTVKTGKSDGSSGLKSVLSEGTRNSDGASIYSKGSVATKGTIGSGKIEASHSIPKLALEDGMFAIPAQEVEVVYTGGRRPEHVIGSSNERGEWHDGIFIRRLRVLAEGRGDRHRLGTGLIGRGDVCLPSTACSDASEHSSQSRLLVLDGPLPKLAETMFTGDLYSGPGLTDANVRLHSMDTRCLLLPEGEPLALDAWAHVAFETGNVRNLSPSTLAAVALVHVEVPRRELVRGMLASWIQKMSDKNEDKPGREDRPSRTVVDAVSQFFIEEDFTQDMCCLESKQEVVLTVARNTPAGIAAGRLRNSLLLLEGLLKRLAVHNGDDCSEKKVDGATISKPEEEPDQASYNNSSTNKKSTHPRIRSAAIVNLFISEARAPTRKNSGEQKSRPKHQSLPIPDATNCSCSHSHYDAPVAGPRNGAGTAFLAKQMKNEELKLRTWLLCTYAILWGMGGHLSSPASRIACCDFIRQHVPQNLTTHIREHNLFDFVVDLEHTKLVPVDTYVGPDSVPRAMWSTVPYWRTQASEICSPLPPSIVIPSGRVRSLVAIVYLLLRQAGANVLLQGPTGSGKTSLCSQLLRVMGEHVPDPLAIGTGDNSGQGNHLHGLASQGSYRGSTDDGTGREGLEHDEAHTDRHITMLGKFRKDMAEAAQRVDTVHLCPLANVSPDSTHGREGVSMPCPPGTEESFASLPCTAAYISIRHQLSPDNIVNAIERAMQRERAGVLEPPQGSRMVLFLDDVHLAEEGLLDVGPGGCHRATGSVANPEFCGLEILRSITDVPSPLGKFKTSPSHTRAMHEAKDGLYRSTQRNPQAESTLPHLSQVHPDFVRHYPSGPGTDAYNTLSRLSILAVRSIPPRDEGQSDSLEGTSSFTRLWRTFYLLTLASPGEDELRSIFVNLFGETFGGDGPIVHAFRGQGGQTLVFNEDVTQVADTLGTHTVDFIQRLQRRLRDDIANGASSGEAGFHLDYSLFLRLMRPLMFSRPGEVSTVESLVRLWCHEILREVVEPLDCPRKRYLAVSELALHLRERSRDMRIDLAQEKRLEDSLLHANGSPLLWANTKGLITVIAEIEQQLEKQVKKSHAPPGPVNPSRETSSSGAHAAQPGELGVPGRQPIQVVYQEVCSVEDEHGIAKGDGKSEGNVIVAHGVVLSTKAFYGPVALGSHMEHALGLYKIPWPTTCNGKPLITSDDVIIICKALRQLSLPYTPLVRLMDPCRGLGTEGSPGAAFHLACAMEGVSYIEMDAGTGRLSTKAERLAGSALSEEARAVSIRLILRKAVLSCLGRSARPGPVAPSTDNKGSEESFDPFTCMAPLVATRTVLLVPGAVQLSRVDDDGWSLQALAELVERGIVQHLFMDKELLALAAGEEEWLLKQGNLPATENNEKNIEQIEEGAAEDMIKNSQGECSLAVSHYQKHSISNMDAPSDFRWLQWTRVGADFMCRRVVSMVRQSLTVVLCLADGEVSTLAPSLPSLCTCPVVRITTWRDESLSQVASEVLAQPMEASVTVSLPKLWPSASHANKFGILAFDRLQNTTATSASGTYANLDGNASELFKTWMEMGKLACVAVYKAVGDCLGKVTEPPVEGDLASHHSALEERCYQYLTDSEHGFFGGLSSSLVDMLSLFRHLCRLGCQRISKRSHCLKKAVASADSWNLREDGRESTKVALEQTLETMAGALAENTAALAILQDKKTKAQALWQKRKSLLEGQRSEQREELKKVELLLGPRRTALEGANEMLTSLGDEEMEYLCVLCVGVGTTMDQGAKEHISNAAKQRAQRGLHPELPFIVESIAVLLGNFTGYSKTVGEWVRLNASPSVQLVRAMLLDPALPSRLTMFNPEADVGRKVLNAVMHKIKERIQQQPEFAHIKDKGKYNYLSTLNMMFLPALGTRGKLEAEHNSDVEAFVQEIPVTDIKRESRAGGIIAFWLGTVVTFHVARQRADQRLAEIEVAAGKTHEKEDQVKKGETEEVSKLDKEMATLAQQRGQVTFDSGGIKHRRSLLQDLCTFDGVLEDALAAIHQEIEDTTQVAESFPGDSLCLSAVVVLAAHLPHPLRTLALHAARDAVTNRGVPVCTSGRIGARERARSDPHIQPNGTNNSVGSIETTLASNERFGLGNFVGGVLTNLSQLQWWAVPPIHETKEESSDESDGNQDIVRTSSNLPFHPAFMDAAAITLVTPKWPLLVDPEGVGLRWLRSVYPSVARFETPLPASAVNGDIIASFASKGEVLVASNVEGGIHPDLALFICSKTRSLNEGQVGAAVVLGGGAQGDMELKPGFRLILLTNSLQTASVYNGSQETTEQPVVLLRDSLSVLSRVQLIRFGGEDSVGAGAHALHPSPECLALVTEEPGFGETSSSEDDDQMSTGLSTEPALGFPALVFGGMGLLRLPGYETSLLLEAEMLNSITESFDETDRDEDNRMSLAGLRREIRACSEQLGAAHEAIVGLLSTDLSSFVKHHDNIENRGVPLGMAYENLCDIPSVDQNRVLNTLLDFLFTYKSVLDTSHITVSTCGKEAQAQQVDPLLKARSQAQCISSEALAIIARCSEGLHACGVDPALFDPAFTGVRSSIRSVLRTVIDRKEWDAKDGQGTIYLAGDEARLKKYIVRNLMQKLAARLPPTSIWILPIATVVATMPKSVPEGWWRTFVALLAERNDRKRSNAQVSLADIFISPRTPGNQSHVAREVTKKSGKEGREAAAVPPSDIVARIRQRLGALPAGMPASKNLGAPATVSQGKEGDFNKAADSRKRRMPHLWDTTFDTSEWEGKVSMVIQSVRDCRASSRGDCCREDENSVAVAGVKKAPSPQCFLDKVRELWTQAKEGRSSMSSEQAANAKQVCDDEVMRRAIMIEASMGSFFSKLSLHVLAQAAQWKLWLEEV